MLHTMAHWPKGTKLDLKLFTDSHVVYLWNNLPRQYCSLSPNYLFYDLNSNHADKKNVNIWKCPTYVLDPM